MLRTGIAQHDRNACKRTTRTRYDNWNYAHRTWENNKVVAISLCRHKSHIIRPILIRLQYAGAHQTRREIMRISKGERRHLQCRKARCG